MAHTYMGVGLALSQWEYFESILGRFYSFIIGIPKDTSPAMRAYGAVSSFSTRIDMIIEAGKALYFRNNSSEMQKINLLAEEARGFSLRRNEIAHVVVQRYYTGGVVPGYALGPSMFATRKKKLIIHPEDFEMTTDVYAYTYKELLVFSGLFSSLAENTKSLYLGKRRP